MTREEIMEMDVEQLTAAKEELRSAGASDDADFDALGELLNAVEERANALRDNAEKRAAFRAAIANGEGTVTRSFEEKKEDKTMDIMEIRSSQEYSKAYLKAIKGDLTEARALLSGNVSGGQIPVPTMLETEIKNAWENNQLMGLVKKSFFAGNVKVGFELSATGAVIHTEGTEAPAEEVLEIGTVELKPENIKKWITVSDEAIEGTTVDTMGYLFQEIAHKIVSKAEEVLVGKITAAPTASTATAAAVAEYTATTVDVDTIVQAVARLSAQAKDLHIAMARQTYAAFVSKALKANYGVDVFDGLRDRVVFTDALKPFATASSGETYAIVGDFAYGAQANFPNGNEVTLKVDDLSLAEQDLVKFVGRQSVGMGVVAPMAFCRIVK